MITGGWLHVRLWKDDKRTTGLAMKWVENNASSPLGLVSSFQA